MRKAKGHLELNLSGDIQDNKKGFYKCISSKRKLKENAGSLLNQMDVLVTEDREEEESLNAFFASASTAEISPQGKPCLGQAVHAAGSLLKDYLF